jgi:AAA+ superfamily predicted ATPase
VRRRSRAVDDAEMKALALDGNCTFTVGADRVDLRVERITNNRDTGSSSRLAVRLWALKTPAHAGKLNGLVAASEELPPLHGGQSIRGFAATVATAPIPGGYYYCAMTLEESHPDSPNGWYIMDMVTFEEPTFFGKRLSVERFTVDSRSPSKLLVGVGEVRNEMREATGSLRISLWASREPYDGGPIRGFRLAVQELSALAGGDTYRDLSWVLDRSPKVDAARMAVLLLEERWPADVQRYQLVAHCGMEMPAADAPPEGGDEPLISEADLIGQARAKAALNEVIALARVNEERRRRNFAVPRVTFHAAFTGSPGTGKTTFARFYTQQIRALGLLKRGHLVEVSRAALVAEFSGQTAVKTSNAVKSALGGVLFVDEAYALKTGRDDAYGQECIDTLVKMMEDHRDELVVIFAGYSAEMREFLRQNSGLESRVPHVIEFEDFNDTQLGEILDRFCERAGVTISPQIRGRAIEQVTARRRGRSFGNARDVRNVFERALARQAVRLQQTDLVGAASDELSRLVGEDFVPDAEVAEDGLRTPGGSLGGALEQVMGLVGLENVKRDMRETAALVRVERARRPGAGLPSVGLNRLYAGPHGTGKKTVARHYAAFLCELRLLSRGHIVEASRADFVAGYLGQTSEKTRKRLEEAMGGVLYVVDAPGLWLRGDKYEMEAVDTLLAVTETNRDKVVIVLSGAAAELDRIYREDSRLRRIFSPPLQFDSPSTENLVEIGLRLARSSGYQLSDAARVALRASIEAERNSSEANAGWVRDLLERAYIRRAVRLESMGDPAALDPELLHRVEDEDFEQPPGPVGPGRVQRRV